MKRISQSTRVLLSCVGLTFGCDSSSSKSTPDASTPPPPPRVRSTERGVVAGRITVNGAVPPQAAQPLPSNLHGACGETVPDQSLVVSADGALQNAVVVVDDEPADGQAAKTAAPLIDQRRCAYQPAVLLARAQGQLKVKNSDALLHNVRATAGSQPVFNVAMPLEEQTITRVLPARAGPMAVRCDVHPWMRADVYLVEHALAAVTDADGRFRLENVEAGERPITIWHPRFGSRTVTVKVPANDEAQLPVAFDASALRPR